MTFTTIQAEGYSLPEVQLIIKGLNKNYLDFYKYSISNELDYTSHLIVEDAETIEDAYTANTEGIEIVTKFLHAKDTLKNIDVYIYFEGTQTGVQTLQEIFTPTSKRKRSSGSNGKRSSKKLKTSNY